VSGAAATEAATKRETARPPQRWSAIVELLIMITSREISIRYKQSVMGFLWALFMPTMIVGAGLIVRAAVAHVSGGQLAGDALAAMAVKALAWAFFVTGVRLATSSLAANSALVTRARCPRIVFPLSGVLSALFDLLVAAVPLAVVLMILGTPVHVQILWTPVLVGMLVALVGGLGVLLSTANLFYRDVKYIVEVVLMFGIFLTPVLFETSALGDLQRWIWLNPLTPLMEGLYAVLVLGRAPDLGWVAYSAIVTVTICVGAAFLFRRLEPTFADHI